MTPKEKKQFKLSLAQAAKNGIDALLNQYRSEYITTRLNQTYREVEVRVATPAGPVYFEVQVKERY